MHTHNRRSLYLLVALVLALVVAGFVVAAPDSDHPTTTTTTPPTLLAPPSALPAPGPGSPAMTGGSDAAAFYHAGAYMWGGVKQSDYRYVWVFDRSTDPNTSAAVQTYISAMQSFWSSYPGMPYPLYYADHGNNGNCWGDGTAGHLPGNSIVLLCNGSPLGNYGQSFWSIDSGTNHLRGESDVWITPGADQGHQYTGLCHEFGHILAFPGHDNDPASCMYSPINLSSPSDSYKGYTADNLQTMLGLYYSHGLGGAS
jgi:hypothetical protein